MASASNPSHFHLPSSPRHRTTLFLLPFAALMCRLQTVSSHVSCKGSTLSGSLQGPLGFPVVVTRHELLLLASLFTPSLFHHLGLTCFLCSFLLQDPKYPLLPSCGPPAHSARWSSVSHLCSAQCSYAWKAVVTPTDGEGTKPRSPSIQGLRNLGAFHLSCLTSFSLTPWTKFRLCDCS